MVQIDIRIYHVHSGQAKYRSLLEEGLIPDRGVGERGPSNARVFLSPGLYKDSRFEAFCARYVGV